MFFQWYVSNLFSWWIASAEYFPDIMVHQYKVIDLDAYLFIFLWQKFQTTLTEPIT